MKIHNAREEIDLFSLLAPEVREGVLVTGQNQE